MTEIEEIIKALEKFRDARHWQQFHSTKDLALALSIEAAELNELFLWKPKSVKPQNMKNSGKSWPTSSRMPSCWPASTSWM